MKTAPVVWIAHPACARHDMGADHPESPARLRAIEDRLLLSGLAPLLRREEAPEASVEALCRVHDPAHVQRLLDLDARAAPVPIDPDTVFGAHTRAAALRAAGAALRGVELVLADTASLAFCAVRPPGHHAERRQAMGFCFFNNVAVAAAEALARGLTRVAILDFDVHYGNGTADIFHGDRRVLLLSTYGEPLYPFWAGDASARNLIDVPLHEGTGSADFREAVRKHWLPVLEAQRPELILVSAGFDAHGNDPLGNLRLGAEDFRWLGSLVHETAQRFCQGRAVAVLEGGYDLDALACGVEAFLRPFLGDAVPV